MADEEIKDVTIEIKREERGKKMAERLGLMEANSG
jgi:hypothetical protein